MNDERITKASIQNILDCDAYLLFYQKSNKHLINNLTRDNQGNLNTNIINF